jgi:hypothetical protein
MSQRLLALTAASVLVSVLKSPVQHLNLLALPTCPETQKVGHTAVRHQRPIPPRPLKSPQGLLPPDGR